MGNPAADSDPALFLHGPDAGAPDVYIVWRAELDGIEPDGGVDRVVPPPIPDEAPPLPIHAMRAWLGGADANDVADTEHSGTDVLTRQTNGRQALCWRGDESRPVGAADLQPGDTLIVPSSYGGCDRFGWHPASTAPVEDIGDLAALVGAAV